MKIRGFAVTEINLGR